jgi:hypothetical protein
MKMNGAMGVYQDLSTRGFKDAILG